MKSIDGRSGGVRRPTRLSGGLKSTRVSWREIHRADADGRLNEGIKPQYALPDPPRAAPGKIFGRPISWKWGLSIGVAGAALLAGVWLSTSFHDRTLAAKSPEAQVDEAFARLDSNQDGFLSRKEFQGRRSRHFDEIDANGDGKIDRAELLAWIVRHDARADRPGKHLGRGRGKGELKM